jgi:hypothetical protein
MPSGTFLHCGDDAGSFGPSAVMSIWRSLNRWHSTVDALLNKLRSLEKEYQIDLEDACVVERDEGG